MTEAVEIDQQTSYRGTVDDWSVTVDGEQLNPRLDVMNLWPEFGWGYLGRAPLQLALAILANHTGSAQAAIDLHRRFCVEVISQLRPVNFTLPAAYVQGWIDGIALLPGETERTRGRK